MHVSMILGACFSEAHPGKLESARFQRIDENLVGGLALFVGKGKKKRVKRGAESMKSA